MFQYCLNSAEIWILAMLEKAIGKRVLAPITRIVGLRLSKQFVQAFGTCATSSGVSF